MEFLIFSEIKNLKLIQMKFILTHQLTLRITCNHTSFDSLLNSSMKKIETSIFDLHFQALFKH
jgi:predicted aldo/keto reductase-like oxidoreductase